MFRNLKSSDSIITIGTFMVALALHKKIIEPQLTNNRMENFKKALTEVANWETRATKKQRSTMTYYEIKNMAIEKVFKKYKDKIISGLK